MKSHRPAAAKIAFIKLDEKHIVILDAYYYSFLIQYHWKAVRKRRAYYAQAIVGKPPGQVTTMMHTLIMNTPKGCVCHHMNRNSLDNRKANLVNMTRKAHEVLHSDDTLLVQYESGKSPELTTSDTAIT